MEKSAKEIVLSMEPISLSEMDSVKLLNRTDTKYVFESSKIPLLLADAQNKYRVLHVEGNPFQDYRTMYYDTADKLMYHIHQTGRANRYKIRYRTYMSSGVSFLETKFKNNKGVTYKKRIPFDNVEGLGGADDFLREITPFKASELLPTSLVEYTRVTLVNLEDGERVTIDMNLQVTNQETHEKIDLSHVCIIELKREKSKNVSLMGSILRKHRIFQNGMSKYSIGTAAIHNDIRLNRFKKKLRYLDKLKNKQ